jgi:hypothetical protein
MGASLAGTEQVADTATAKRGVLGMAADIAAVMPAAFALGGG